MSQKRKLKLGLGQRSTNYPVAGKRADRVEEGWQRPRDLVKGTFMNLKKNFSRMLIVRIFSGWLLIFLTVLNAWCMSGSETYWYSALAKGKEGEDLTFPKDFPAPKPPHNFQPREQDQEPPVIAPPITDPEMVLPPPVTDPEMVVTPDQDGQTEKESTQEERRQR
jgi:hypothetical protein